MYKQIHLSLEILCAKEQLGTSSLNYESIFVTFLKARHLHSNASALLQERGQENAGDL